MTTYVLGAGASRHAGYPLTADLGKCLHEWVRQSDSVVRPGFSAELNDLYPGLTHLEQILTDLYERPAGAPVAALSKEHCEGILAGITNAIPEFFYSLCQKPIDGPDLYEALARCRIRSGDAILTFNYDLACERALKKEGMWEIGDGYGDCFRLGGGITPPSKTKVLKLHGSTNWLGLLFGGTMGYSGASNENGPRPCLFGERDFTYLGYSENVRDPLCEHISTFAVVRRALILPTLHKNFFLQTSFEREWEPFWDDIWSEAARALNASEKIVIIGYSMPKADERARDLLLKGSNPNAEILVFSGSRTCAICKEFRDAGFQNVNSFGKGHFENYLNA